MHAERLLELAAQPSEALAHLHGRTERAKRVVLVRDRGTEHGDDGVPEELADAAAMALADGVHLAVVANEEPLQRLGIESLPELGGAGEHRAETGDAAAELA